MKLMIAVPCLDHLLTDFVISKDGLICAPKSKVVYSKSSLVYDSRNGLARQAIVNGFDRVLWLDSDMQFNPDMLDKLTEDLETGADVVSGFYVTRKGEIKPCIFSECEYKHIEEKNAVKAVAKTYYDYPRDSLFEIAACGFGAVLMNTKVLEDVEKNFGLPFAPMMGFGEDLSFCLRARELGYKIYCDSRIKVGHIGFYVYTEDDYLRSLNNATDKSC